MAIVYFLSIYRNYFRLNRLRTFEGEIMKFLLSVIALCLLMIKAQQRILVLEKELIHKKKSSKVIGITRKSPNTNHKQLRNRRVF